jgi:DsbC/DsbD-like thiol-disulfide interchange protein
MEWKERRRTKFLGNDEYDYSATPPVDVKIEDKKEPAALKIELFFGKDV